MATSPRWGAIAPAPAAPADETIRACIYTVQGFQADHITHSLYAKLSPMSPGPWPRLFGFELGVGLLSAWPEAMAPKQRVSLGPAMRLPAQHELRFQQLVTHAALPVLLQCSFK